jgi:thioredoxin-related protein
MKSVLIVLFLFQHLSGFSQEKLNLFRGSFAQALDSAKKVDKDIFLITKSLTCHVFEEFNARIIANNETIMFLNENFIVFVYDKDKSSEKEDKRMKNYYHSWRGFPQLYFIDKNEKLITDLVYTLSIEQQEQLKIWKTYKSIEKDWKSIKYLRKNKIIDYNDLTDFLTYRQIKYSPFDLIQISGILDKYFKNLDSAQYCSKQNWELIKNYVSLRSNPDIFDLVAKHKTDFQKNYGDSIISDYLLSNYQQDIYWRKPEKVDKIAEKYPYDSIPEAIQAIETYKKNKQIQSLVKDAEN